MNPADLTESFEIFQECYNEIRTFRAVIMPQTNQLLRRLDAHDRIIEAQGRIITALSGTIGSLNDEVRSLNILVQQLSQNPQPQANVLPPPPPVAVPAPGADDTLPARVPRPLSPPPRAPQPPQGRVDPPGELGPLSPTTRRLFEEMTEIKNHHEKMKQRHSDNECSKSIILSGIGLTEQLQTRNNQHRNPGRMVPEVKRALSHFGLEGVTYMADKYRVYPSGALKISYSSKIDARRQLVYLRRRVGQLKRDARDFHDTMDHEYLYRSNHKYRAACDMKFSQSIPGRFQHERELFKKAAKILKSRNEIKWWECHMIGEQLVMKTRDRRNTFKYVALDEAEEICRQRPGATDRNEIEE